MCLPNVAILFSSFGPYHVARIDAFGMQLRNAGTELLAFRFSDTSSTYNWLSETPSFARTVTLAGSEPRTPVEALRIAGRMYRHLKRYSIKAILLPSYSPFPNFCCLFAAKFAGCKTILMTESWSGTDRASFFAKMAKHLLVRVFDAALVGGSHQRDYVVKYGMPKNKVFLGYDVVDNQYYKSASEEYRRAASNPIEGLPKRYFLNLGRFVAKKNLSLLIDAYAEFVRLREPTVDTTSSCSVSNSVHQKHFPALVLVGEGPERDELESRAHRYSLRVRNGLTDTVPLGGAEVVFYPFQQRNLTPFFFANCEAFVLPSLWEEWGLVINEALACGAPVLVSNNVGCRRDLVEDGVNGYGFDPGSVKQLTSLLIMFHDDPSHGRHLGGNGQISIEAWSPSRFGVSGHMAIKAAFTR